MRLVDHFENCFVVTLRHLDAFQAAGASPTGELRKTLQDELDRAVEGATADYESRTLFLARRLVTAWIDERLCSDDWPGREEWIALPLQSDWGEGRSSGKWFFDMIESLDAGKPGQAELAGLALRCLTLTLEGSFHAEPDGHREVRRRLARRFGLETDAQTFPPPVSASRLPSVSPKGRGMIGVTLALILLLVGGYLLADRALELRLGEVLSAYGENAE